MSIEIRDVRAICTAPEGINLVAVKIETNEPELYGVGCATFAHRYSAVVTVINDYLRPFLIGKDPSNIEDIWQSVMGMSYWRNGPVLNNALSGVDMALWDIKGKLANMPVYELFGGKCREAAAVYRHTDGSSPEEVEENVLRYLEEGYRYLRCQHCIALLEQGQSMGDIAAAMNFSSQNYLSTFFKREMGVSPSEYLRQNASGPRGR